MGSEMCIRDSIISELLVSKIERGTIFDEQVFSHHAPVIIDYNLSL